MVPNPSFEKPLNGGARLSLVCGAGLTILLFYLFCILSIAALAALLGIELLLVVALIRFGLAEVVTAAIERHVRLVGIFFRSFWLRKGADFKLLLQPEEAPGLFAILQKLCHRLDIAAPRDVALQMGVNASVRLKGYRRGAGKTTLAIGYDLLAGLSEVEIEGVLAHEMVHAKLIQRGLWIWLHGGLRRLSSLSGALSVQVHAYKRVKRQFPLAEYFLRISDSLGRRAARLIATYSRQDEFDADRGAAELCGAATMRSVLLKLDPLQEKVSRLPWRDRVAQIQLAEGFSQWLVRELSLEGTTVAVDHTEVADRYSTHPLIRDRVAALPETAGADDNRPTSPSAIGLLADPDAVATKLILEIQRVLAQEEQKDSKELRRWIRKAQRSTEITPQKAVALVIIIVGIIAVGDAFFGKTSIPGILAGLAIGTSGFFVWRFAEYKDRIELPIPEFGRLEKWSLKKQGDISVRQKQLEEELRKRIAEESKYRRTKMLVTECYAALAKCDYLRAHESARLCYEFERKSVEVLLGLAVAAAALRLHDQASWALTSVQKKTGLKSVSTMWGAAWVLVLQGEWKRAEAFLEKALKERPNQPTFLALLSVCQSRRGKSRSALLSARRACAPGVRTKDSARLLIDLLLDSGHWREAKELLQPFKADASHDNDLMLSFVRLNLMQREFEIAEIWTEKLARNDVTPDVFIGLAYAYESARKNERAAGFYCRALEAAFYPAAYLGLGRLEVQATNKVVARQYFLSALNVEKTVGENGVSAVALFQRSLNELLALEEPVLNCRAWVASFGSNAAIRALSNQSLMVYGRSQQEAEQYLRAIMSGMHPGAPPPLPTAISWEEAHHDQQPAGAVRPGVQFAFA